MIQYVWHTGTLYELSGERNIMLVFLYHELEFSYYFETSYRVGIYRTGTGTIEYIYCP
jgi:hypothetical protein